jgi:nitroreductase
MITSDAIKKRRSIRNYDPSFKIAENEIKELIELAMLSATSYNIQHWKFVVVTDTKLRKAIREASFGQLQVTDASSLILVCADTKAWEKDMKRKWQDAPKDVSDFMIARSKVFYESKEQLQRDEAIRSASFATQTLVLSAISIGYETGIMIGFESEKVAKLINLPNNYIISNFVVIGKGIEKPFVRGGQLPISEVLIKDRFYEI